ncbi:MAG: SDR family NAD(P)-dependent oxidoreductase [Paracoccaceae bacterium]
MRMFDLSGRVALVTGGNGGLGLAMATGLAQAGARLALVGRNADKGAQAVAGLRAAGHEAEFLAADVTDEAAAQAVVEAVAGRAGRLDILINNAGQALRKLPQDYTLADWHRVVDTNLTSAFVMCNAAYPRMKAGAAGRSSTSPRSWRRWRRRSRRSIRRRRGAGAADPGAGHGLGGRGHPLQRDPAGMDRHRSDGKRPRRG